MELNTLDYNPPGAEVPHTLLPGWHACLANLAALDHARPAPTAPSARRIAAANWPARTAAGRGPGTRALPYSRTRTIARPGLTIAQAIARGACPRYLRHAVARGWLVLAP